jgi:hypothetical protein
LYPFSPEPPASVEALQATSIRVQLGAVAETPVGTDGGVVSAQAGVFVVAVGLDPDTFSALSTAFTEYEYTVDAARPVSDVDVAGTRTRFRNAPFR